jgi:hypothetical protein
MEQGIRPKTGRKAGSVKQTADHNAEGAIQAFHFGVLVRSITTGRFDIILSLGNSSAESGGAG